MSKKLVQLVDDVKIVTPLEDLRLPEPDGKTLVAFFKAMEFTTLTRRVAEIYDADMALVDPDPAFVGPNGWRARNGDVVAAPAQAETAPEAMPTSPRPKRSPPPRSPRQRKDAALKTPFDRSQYVCVSSLEDLEKWISDAFDAGFVSFDIETDSLDPMQANLVGLSLALAPNRACYVPFGHRAPGAEDLFGGADLVPGQVALGPALALLKPLLTSPAVMKIAQNVKFDWLVLAQHGIEVAPVQDTLLASYTLDAGVNGHGMDELVTQNAGPSTDSVQRSRRTGQEFYWLRQGGARQGRRIFGRGCRRHLAVVERLAAASGRGTHDHGL